MVVKTESKYANTVTSQNNTNIKNRTKWTKPENAIGYVTNTTTDADFTKKKYATHYKTEYKKDKNGKEIAVKKADKWDYKYTHPYTLSGHDFRFDIPVQAKITKVSFDVRMRSTASNIPKPRARFCLYGGAYSDNLDNTKSFKTGWNNGIYYSVPSGNLSNAFSTYTYTMDKADVEKANAPHSKYEDTVFGVDLEFYDAFKDDKADDKTGSVKVEWIKCTIEYILPDAYLEIVSPYDVSINNPVKSNAEVVLSTTKGTQSDPHTGFAFEKFPLNIKIYNGSSVPKNTTVTTFEIPDGTEISNIRYDSPTTYDTTTNKWTTKLGGKDSKTLTFDVLSKRSGLHYIKANVADPHGYSKDYFYYYYTNPYDVHGDGDSKITISAPELHRMSKSCVDIVIDGYSNDYNVNIGLSTVAFQYNQLNIDLSECLNVSEILSQSDNSASFRLTEMGEYRIVIHVCGYPNSTTTSFTVTNNDDPTNPFTQSFNVLDPYEYHIGFNPSVSKINNHRVISDLDTNASIIPIVADENDATMIMSECTLYMDKWNDLDYIGCIPLEQTHFDPKSTFKDTLLDSHYKNKRYMGKKLATDEDITLNVRLRPMQVTTLQGLIEMDKPIPINANHKCFESDALNHRGWAEIYGVKTEQTGNNPHWYKCDIDVKYLTHNLNTRFNIQKGDKSDDEKFDIPNLMIESFSSGENISDMESDPFVIDTISDAPDNNSYFKVDTDGTFYYNDEVVVLTEEFRDDNDNAIIYTSSGTYSFVLNGISYSSLTTIDDVVEILGMRGYDIVTPVLNQTLKYQITESVPIYQRNNFSLNNGQHLTITSSNPLTQSSIVDFTWSSALIDEYRENAVSRIIRLINRDDNNRVVFEYEYNDIIVEDDEVKAEVIYRVWDGKTFVDGSDDITFRYNPSNYTTESDEIIYDDEVDVQTGDAHYGTTTTFIVNNGKLSIRDAGFNGREVAEDDIKLPDGSYYYQVEWINNNMDDDTSDIDCIFDFRVQDTILTTTYSDKWGKLVVSPFPIKDKKILFTRQAEDGIIYYYVDDGEEFSFMIEPYYQYLNGTDLVYNESSIFDLNYGYEVVYIQNGLVRLGFNRLNGELYLGKYDNVSESYITVSRIHLQKFDDINLNSITDDKIEIQASDSVFTIWRGHPYIRVKHELEDLMLDTQYNTVWAEQVGKDSAVQLPAYWDLMNNKNLLPSSVGGNTTLKSSDVTIESVFVPDRVETSLTIDSIDGDDVTYNSLTNTTIALVDSEVTFSLDDEEITYSDIIDVDDSICSFGEIEWSETCDTNTPTMIPSLIANPKIIQINQGTDISAKVTNPCFIGVEGVRVDFYEVYTPSVSIGTDKPIIQTGEKSQIYGKVKDDDGSLVKGIRVDFYILEDD